MKIYHVVPRTYWTQIVPQKMLVESFFSPLVDDMPTFGDDWILDHGVGIGQISSDAGWRTFVDLCHTLRPPRIVLPDIPGDFSRTIKLFRRFLPDLPPADYIAPVQAMQENMASAAQLISKEFGSQITLGIPYRRFQTSSARESAYLRLQWVDSLLQSGQIPNPLHFLGMWHVDEITRSPLQVRSMDSSFAFLLTRESQTVRCGERDVCAKPIAEDEVVPFPLLIENIRALNELCFSVCRSLKGGEIDHG